MSAEPSVPTTWQSCQGGDANLGFYKPCSALPSRLQTATLMSYSHPPAAAAAHQGAFIPSMILGKYLEGGGELTRNSSELPARRSCWLLWPSKALNALGCFFAREVCQPSLC